MGLVVLPKVLVPHTDALAADVMADYNAILAQLNGNLDSENLAAAIREALFEPGDLKASFKAAAPSGWLLCNGSAVSREAYKALFEAIGTSAGAGDGKTTFNLPDYRGSTIVGVDGGAARLNKNNALGNRGGHEYLETHTHHINFNTSGESSTHKHWQQGFAAINVAADGPNSVLSGTAGQWTGVNDVGHWHAVTGDTQAAGTGSGGNMPPYQVANVFIKT